MNYKKLGSILMTAALLGSLCFAIDLSAGGGIDLSFMKVAAKTSNKIEMGNMVTSSTGKVSAKTTLFGVNGFFDAQYFTAKLGLAFKVGSVSASSSESTTVSIDGKQVSSTSSSGSSSDANYKFSYFELGLFGKYPFTVGIAKLYPIAGLDFKFNVKATYSGNSIKEGLGEDEKKAFNAHYFVLGFGSDVFVTDKLFLRPLGLFGIQMNSPAKQYSSDAERDFSYMVNVGFSVGYQIQ